MTLRSARHSSISQAIGRSSRRVAALVQVSANISEPTTREREIRALREGMEELGVRTSTIVTMNDTETVEVDSGSIHVVPAWRWLLSEKRGRA